MNPVAQLLILISLLNLVIAWPLAGRKINRNRWYGFRLPEAFKSDENWFAINEFGGRLLLRLGFVILVVAIIGLALPKSCWIIYNVVALAITIVGLIICTTRTFRFARQFKDSNIS